MVTNLNRINTNISSFKARETLNKINDDLNASRLKLSTGKKINSAEDNSSGFAVSNKLKSHVAGLEQALQNVDDAKSMLDIVENAYNSIIENLTKLKSLATKAASGTIATGSDEMAYLASQMEAIGNEINDIADKATFNGKDLIGSSRNDTFSIQTGEGILDTFEIGLSEISMKTIFPVNSLGYPNSTFFEDFNDNDLSDFNHNGGNLGSIAEVRGGSYDGSSMLHLEQSTWANLSISTKSKFGFGSYSYRFKINDSGGYIYGSLMGGEEIRYLIKESDGMIQLRTSDSYNVDTSYTGIGVDTWYEAQIEVNSNSAKVRINDQVISEIAFPNELSDGEILLKTAVSNSGIDIDDILYTPNDGENIYIDANTVTNSDMRELINNVDIALETMNSKVNELGINQRSLSSKEENLTQAITANSAAYSRIMDTDFAKEQSNSIRLQILQQTAIAALTQANMGPQAVLGLLD